MFASVEDHGEDVICVSEDGASQEDVALVKGETFGGVLIRVLSWVFLEENAAAFEGVEKFAGTFVGHVETVAFETV